MKIKILGNECCPEYKGKITTIVKVEKYFISTELCHVAGGEFTDEEVEILTNPDGTPWVEPNYKVVGSLTDMLPSVWGLPDTLEGLRALNQQIKKPIMTTIIEKLKNLTLSAEDRVLRKHGFEDENGKITGQAQRMMAAESADERWAKRRLEVAADLLKLDSEEK